MEASVRITLIDRDVPSYFQSLEHLLRYCARPPFALHRLSVIRGEDGRIARVRYVLPRHKAANWVGPGRGRKSTRPGANGVVELSPFEFFAPPGRSRAAAAEAPASLPRRVRPESPAAKSRHGTRHRQHWQAGRGHDRRAWGRRSRRGRLL